MLPRAAHLAGAADLSDALSGLRRHSNAPGSSGAGGLAAGARQPQNRRAFSGVRRKLQQYTSEAGRAPLPHAVKQNVEPPLRDPESRFRRYGRDFGGNYLIELVAGVTQMRVMRVSDRQKDQLADLAVLNERLSGAPRPWNARQRLEYLKKQREQWEAVYEYLVKTDAAATMESIEEAARNVSDTLSDEARESQSVGQLKRQLTDLQADVDSASQRLAVTKARVAHNMQRIDQLKSEAAQLERMKAAADQAEAALPSPANTVASPAAAALTAAAANAVQPMPVQPRRASTPRPRHLASSLELEPGLRHHWFPAHFSSKLTADKLIPIELFGEPWVLFRDETGAAACVKDECAHRACPLSLGTVVDGQVQCPYHGWEYNRGGECTKMPSTAFCAGVTVTALPCSEKDGLIWVWPGAGEAPSVPEFSRPPTGYTVHAEIEVEVPVEHGLLMENLLDLAHAPFTHTSTFAKGWPIPDVVRFKAAQMLGGNWEPYPIDMSFQPPCMVLSTIGLAQPGKIQRGQRADACTNHLHQLHICLPSKPGHTRLLYRMSMDFLNWTRFVPGIQAFWQHIAGQVLGEDLVLVAGQQDRMQRGADTWAHPVSYDKLAVRYRRWRNTVGALDEPASLPAGGSVQMSAGELFSEEESDAEDGGAYA
jgi:chlorophyllide a oxygenase